MRVIYLASVRKSRVQKVSLDDPGCCQRRLSRCFSLKYKNKGKPNDRPTMSVAGTQTHNLCMPMRHPSINTKRKKIAADIIRSAATELETLLVKIYSKNRDTLISGSPRNINKNVHGTITPNMQSIRQIELFFIEFPFFYQGVVVSVQLDNKDSIFMQRNINECLC